MVDTISKKYNKAINEITTDLEKVSGDMETLEEYYKNSS